MNIAQLKYLVAAVKTGSFVSAAKSLYVSPQAVSKGLSDLGKELNVELFVKFGKRIEPTFYGRMLASKALEIIQSYEDLERLAYSLSSEEAGDAEISGSLSIAIASSPYGGSIITETFLMILPNDIPKSPFLSTTLQAGLVFLLCKTTSLIRRLFWGGSQQKGISAQSCSQAP